MEGEKRRFPERAEQERANFYGAREGFLGSRLDADSLTEFLSQEFQGICHQDFEGNLGAKGWLSRLEQAGILPTEKESEERDRALRLLYIGAMLRALDEQLLITPSLIFTAVDRENLLDQGLLDGPELTERRGLSDPVRFPAPVLKTLMEWEAEGGCEAIDGCWIELGGRCEHGCPSWLLVMGQI
jgi:hypothetical protein